MIEVIYKEDKEDQGTVQEPFSMPRNVRQIGLANGDYRIYIEDYVYTFLCSLAEDGETESQGNVAVLTGEIQWTTDMTCIYVKGALAADGMDATAEHIDFSEKIWQKIQNEEVTKLTDQLHQTFDKDERAKLAVELQQDILDDDAFFFVSHLNMGIVTKSNVTGMAAHPCDYYEITADLDVE